LIKNISDTFIKNTRDDLKDIMHSLTNHIDNNEKMVSNLSGIALRSRLQGLESRCTSNQKAYENIIKIRLKCLFTYIKQTQGILLNPNDIEVKFTPNIPIDVNSIADMISKLPHDVVSFETLRSLLPFISTVEVEAMKIKNEKEELIKPQLGVDLDGIN
ncbi:MAG: phage portal protein, partial [Peptostreptococcaceae bacterium]